MWHAAESRGKKEDLSSEDRRGQTAVCVQFALFQMIRYEIFSNCSEKRQTCAVSLPVVWISKDCPSLRYSPGFLLKSDL
jgi:hypothetical protein